MIWTFFLVLTELVNFQPTGKSIYSQKFGQLDDDSPLIQKFISFIPTIEDYDSGNRHIGKIQFIFSGYNDLLFVICADKADEIVPFAQALENMKVAFAQKYFNLIKEGKADPALFKSFKADVDRAMSGIGTIDADVASSEPAEVPTPTEKAPPMVIKKEIVKIAFIGSPNVGKKTILNLLFTGPEGKEASVEESEMTMKKGPISDKYNALLLTMPNEMIITGKTQFLSNTDVVVFVTNSTFKDIMATRKIYEEIKLTLPNAHFGVIANKQDLEGAVEPEAIQKVYELPIIPLIAVDSANYDMIQMFIIDLIEAS